MPEPLYVPALEPAGPHVSGPVGRQQATDITSPSRSEVEAGQQ